MDEAEQLCDRLVVMDKAKIGRRVATRSDQRYSTREILELRLRTTRDLTLRSGLDGIAERVEWLPDRVLLYTETGEGTALARSPRARVIHPESALVRRASLEDVFLTITGRILVELSREPLVVVLTALVFFTSTRPLAG